MKKVINYPFLFLIAIAVIISSCATDKSGSFTSRKYTNFDNRQASVHIAKPQKQHGTNDILITPSSITVAENKITKEENNISASVVNESTAAEYKIKPSHIAIAKVEKLAASTNISNESKIEAVKKSEVTKTSKEKKKPAYDELLLILLAIFIPPVAVYLVKGISSTFWWNLFFTLCCGLPGVIHALIVVLGNSGGRGSDQRRSGAN